MKFEGVGESRPEFEWPASYELNVYPMTPFAHIGI